MMKVLVIVFAVIVFVEDSAEIYGEYHMQPDKKLHLGAGIIIGAGSYFICPKFEELIFDESRIYPPVWSIGMAGLAGAGKEIIYDDMLGRGYADIKDFYYTLIGGAISGITLGIFESVFKIKNNNLYLEANPINKNIAISYFHSY